MDLLKGGSYSVFLERVKMTSVASDMYEMVMQFPDLLTKLKMDQDTKETCIRLGNNGLGGVVTLGMGGSAIAGLYVQALFLDSSPIPIIANREYILPKYVDSNWCAIAVSYSGNTEETLTACNEAIKRNCRLFTVGSGGKLSQKSESLNKIKIPGGYQPRAAFPLLFSAVLNLVECLLGTEPTDLAEISETLSKRLAQWENSRLAPRTVAQDLAGKIPVFIGSRDLVPVAYRAKCQINENAKGMAFFSQIPEANHNEIESFVDKNRSNIKPIFLRSSYEDARIKKRIDITTSLYEEEGFSPVRLSIESSSKIEEMLALTYYLDLVSVELAHIRGVDPLSVERISRLKGELG
ncbi:MAG: bifunctional phosphoglucose/phosphomannose isomerase [Candidatus Thorarchaeota archaeon]|nr:bifunctional phosphoglucose/phosphomannose isomerase [Candidatus Thorarchaeota archaeon]